MSCSIRNHYKISKNSVLPKKAKEDLESNEYFEILKHYDEELQNLTEKIWKNEYLNV